MQTAIKKTPFLTFFILSFVITWIGSLLYYLATPAGGQALPAALNFPSALLWYYGPCLSAIIVTLANKGRSGLGNLWQRYLIWNVGWVWYAFIILYPLLLHLVVVGLAWLFGGQKPVFFQAEGVPQGNLWLTLVGLMLFQIFVRGIGEETGWRGFALPHLQSRFSPLSASLLLGVLWGLWHFHPANFSAVLSPGGFFIFLNILATTIIFTWVYNHTQGSLLIAALFHMTLNVAEFCIPIGIADAGFTRHLIQIAFTTLLVAVLVFTSGKQLGYKA